MTRVAVVGHVEWVQFFAVRQLPAEGQIEAADRIQASAGGGAIVAALAIAALGAEVDFFGAFGDDELAERAIGALSDRGIAVHAARRSTPTREVLTFVDARSERSIVTVGERSQPSRSDPLPWERLERMDGVYFTAGDDGVLTAARTARKLVLTPRAAERLGPVPVEFDALVYSADDAAERLWAADMRDHAGLEVVTEGSRGGHWTGKSSGRWQAARLPGPLADSYGAGDSFAGGFTFGLADGRTVAEAAQIGAERGAWAMTKCGVP